MSVTTSIKEMQFTGFTIVLKICGHFVKSKMLSWFWSSQWRCELTPYSQRAHLNYLTESSYWGHSVSSRWLTKWAHTVSLLWGFYEFVTLKVSSLLPLHGELIGMISRIAYSMLTVLVANSWRAHRKLTVWAHLWVCCEVDEWLQNELAVSFYVSLQRVSCELKFLTGLAVVSLL